MCSARYGLSTPVRGPSMMFSRGKTNRRRRSSMRFKSSGSKSPGASDIRVPSNSTADSSPADSSEVDPRAKPTVIFLYLLRFHRQSKLRSLQLSNRGSTLGLQEGHALYRELVRASPTR